MKTKRLLLGTFIAGILAVVFGSNTFATVGNTAEISGGKTWNICVDAGANYAGSDFVVSIAKTDFASQIVLGNDDCKSVEMAAGTYTASLSSTMGAGTVSYEVADDTLTFSVANSLHKYLNTFGSIAYTVEGSGGESPFELLFSMPGECQFNGNANVSGETCKDGDGNPLTNKKYIDTNVALFSEDNAGRDFEIYFTLTDYATTQLQQGTLFNAKYENSSMYYPGFTIRTVGTNGETMEITGRLGKDNTNADKANNSITTADIKNKEVKIVRVDGMVSYSINGGEMIPFQNYKNFSRYFEQTAVFGASMQTNGTPQRYYNGTIKNIRVYLKKVTTASIVFDANGGTGTMAAIKDIEVGTDVVLPANTFENDGVSFAGWNTEFDGTGASYKNEGIISVAEAGEIHLFAQWERRAVLDSGYAVRDKMNRASGVAGGANANDKIKAIKNASVLPAGFDTSDPWNIVSGGSETMIYMWFDDSDNDEDGEGDGVIYFYTDADRIEGGADMSGLFFGTTALTDISALADWGVSSAENMSFMFANTSSLTDISALADWDVSSVMDMSLMFAGASSLTDISVLADWDVSNVEDMASIFADASSLTDISALADWDVSNVVNMAGMFRGVALLADISALSGWITPNVMYMSLMFAEASSLSNISALASWETSNVADTEAMFRGATSLSDISALADWDVSNVEDMSNMFEGDISIEDVSALAGWIITSAIDMRAMFRGATSLSDISALAAWDVSNVEDMSNMFEGDISIEDVSALAGWIITGYTYDMFRDVPARPLPSWYQE